MKPQPEGLQTWTNGKTTVILKPRDYAEHYAIWDPELGFYNRAYYTYEYLLAENFRRVK